MDLFVIVSFKDGEPITARMILGSLIIFASVITAETKLSFLPFFKNKNK